jgi:hypothetical protein
MKQYLRKRTENLSEYCILLKEATTNEQGVDYLYVKTALDSNLIIAKYMKTWLWLRIIIGDHR